jgi:hypothetical protein
LVAIARISLNYWLYFDVMRGIFKPAGSRAKASVGCTGPKAEKEAPAPYYRGFGDRFSVTVFLLVFSSGTCSDLAAWKWP